MTRRTSIMLLCMHISALALVVMVGMQRLQAAKGAMQSAESSLVRTAQDARTIAELRSRAQVIETRQRPTQDVIAQINAVLAEVGIPAQQLQSLTPEAETAAVVPNTRNGTARNVLGAGLRRQSLRLTLQDLTPQQIGAFLVKWRESQRVWTTGRLELVHNRTTRRAGGGASGDRSVAGGAGIGRAGIGGAGMANRYDVTIVMTALYLADGDATGVAQERP